MSRMWAFASNRVESLAVLADNLAVKSGGRQFNCQGLLFNPEQGGTDASSLV